MLKNDLVTMGIVDNIGEVAASACEMTIRASQGHLQNVLESVTELKATLNDLECQLEEALASPATGDEDA